MTWFSSKGNTSNTLIYNFNITAGRKYCISKSKPTTFCFAFRCDKPSLFLTHFLQHSITQIRMLKFFLLAKSCNRYIQLGIQMRTLMKFPDPLLDEGWKWPVSCISRHLHTAHSRGLAAAEKCLPMLLVQTHPWHSVKKSTHVFYRGFKSTANSKHC